MNSKKLFYASLVVVGYFLFLFLNAYLIKSKFVLIGVFQELITIPMLLGQLILFGFSIKYSISDKFSMKKYSTWSFIILLVSILSTWGSFFRK
jgi:hypothetical protein